MAYFATEYTIHFDDTMAYGSHHFLTGFKFQCASREAFLFGERVFDIAGVKEALDGVHLLTADAYCRNLHPAQLGDRLAILLSLEEWGRASARFCYRVLGTQGQAICAGFQTLICAEASTKTPIELPTPLRRAMEAMREIEERPESSSFRERVLAGGSKLESLFDAAERQAARSFLSVRYPSPQVVAHAEVATQLQTSELPTETNDAEPTVEAWVFAGQASFDARLLSERSDAYVRLTHSAEQELKHCAEVAGELLGGNARALISGSSEQCQAAVKEMPELTQVAIHLQNVLGAKLWEARGHQPGLLLGHSFGEIAALGLGGCFDLVTGVRIVCMRVRAIADNAPAKGGLLVVSCDRCRADIEAHLLGLNGVVIAGRNSDSQTVVSGPIEELQQLQSYLQTQLISATMIPSPTSFHHPHLRSASLDWWRQLRTLALQSPALKVYSPIGRRFIGDCEDIATTLASQLVRPFDLQGGIKDAIQFGVTKFVDCGSSGALASLIVKAGVAASDVCRVSDNSSSVESSATTKHAQIARQLDESEETAAEHRADKNESPAESNRNTVPRIAIVASGCILPGGARNPEQLFSAIIEQRVGIVDQRRLDPNWMEDFYAAKLTPDRSSSPLTGSVSDSDIIVPEGISPQVFSEFTRAQKLLCIALAPCIPALRDARRVLCLIGATADGFEDQDELSALRFAGVDPEQATIRERLQRGVASSADPYAAVQEVFDRLIRPGLKVTLVDAACASSLYSVALGMQALEADQTDAVIAGGFFCPGPGNSCLFSQFRGTTSTGCRPFDAHADGVVFSEGAALVALRRLGDARRLGLGIEATLLGAGLSSDGKSSSANVPQTHGQLLSLERCYKNYRIDPKTIAAIEAHGTSTPVGDSTELETLRQFFASHVRKPIPVHSLKGLLGHAGWAAGTASVIAACQYMKNGVLPPQAMHREPSAALKKSAGTLIVENQARKLPKNQTRIAIDGFGFGGANAHLVLEKYSAIDTESTADLSNKLTTSEGHGELVFVACHQELASPLGAAAPRFDRASIKLPRHHVVLPELADDMDISQTLAVILAEKILEKIPQYDPRLRKETGFVLAMRGKTQRGVEATMRILTPRFRRLLAGEASALERLDRAYQKARPSGTYTLQCMMPNVATGRAALLMNFNGPNFVVDAGANSLEAALESAALMLRSGNDAGVKLAMVGVIQTDAFRGSENNLLDGTPEFAVAFALTTRRFANEKGMQIISTVDDALGLASGQVAQGVDELTAYEKTQKLVEVLKPQAACAPEGSSNTSVANRPALPAESSSAVAAPESKVGPNAPSLARKANLDCPIYIPNWVEKPLSHDTCNVNGRIPKSVLVIVPSGFDRFEELVAVLPEHAERPLIAALGHGSNEDRPDRELPNVLQVNMGSEDGISTALARICDFDAELIVVVDAVTTWNRSEALASLASNNRLCEFLFLVSQQQTKKLESAEVELWGLLLDAWNGEVHPDSGPIAGFLKSIQREFPKSAAGTLCTRGLGLTDALGCLLAERRETDREVEIVYDKDMRLVRRLREASIASRVAPQVALNSDSVIVATGGAKGVTAIMLEALLQDHGCTVIAIGRSQLEAGPAGFNEAWFEQEYYRGLMRRTPQITVREMKADFEAARSRWEAQETIQRLAAVGGQVEYEVANVTNREELDRAIANIVERHGKIDLLLHGAGVQKSKRLQDRSLAEFRDTFSIKVGGIHNLSECCRQHLGHYVSAHVLTSAYSVFGNDGQHDYGAANETLDRLCCLQDSDANAAWSSIAWLAWDAVGMTRGSEYAALAKQRRLTGVDRALGQQLFRQVMSGCTGSPINIPISISERIEYEVRTIPPAIMASGGRVLETRVALSDIDCLPFHKVRKTPTLPGAWILDLLVKTGLKLARQEDYFANLIVENMSFSRFVRFANNREPNVRVVAEQTGNAIEVWMLADVLHSSGVVLSPDVVCALARIQFDQAGVDSSIPGLVAETTLVAASTRCPTQFVQDPYCHNHQQVALSGPFDCLSEIEIDAVSRRATFSPSLDAKPYGFIPALLLDAAWRLGAMYAISGKDDLFVPVKIGKMIFPVSQQTSAIETARWKILSTTPRPEDRNVRWDRTEVIDQSGRLKLVVEDALAARMS